MNNYDKAHREEERKGAVPVNRAKQALNKKRRKIGKPILVCLVVGLIFVLLVLFDVFGRNAANVIYGAMGVAAIAYAFIGILVCILAVLGVKKHKLMPRTIAYSFVLCLLLILFLQVISTVDAYVSCENGTYGEYLNACYLNGRNNAGGFLFGIISYPFLRWCGTITSLCIIAISFFGVLLLCFRSFFYVYRTRRVLVPEQEETETRDLYVESLGDTSKSDKANKSSIDISFPNDISPDEDIPEADINYAESVMGPANAAIKKMLEGETDKSNRKRLASDVLFMPDDKLKHVIGTENDDADDDLPVNLGKRSSNQPQFGETTTTRQTKTEDEPVGGILDNYKKGKLNYAAEDILFGDVVKPRPPKPKEEQPKPFNEEHTKPAAEPKPSGTVGFEPRVFERNAADNNPHNTLRRNPEGESSADGSCGASSCANVKENNFPDTRFFTSSGGFSSYGDSHAVTPEAASGKEPYRNPVVEPATLESKYEPKKWSDSTSATESSYASENAEKRDDIVYTDIDIDSDYSEANTKDVNYPHQVTNNVETVSSTSEAEHQSEQPKPMGYSGGFVRRELPIREEPPVTESDLTYGKEAVVNTDRPSPKMPSDKPPKKLRPYCFPPVELLRDYMPPSDYTDYEGIYNQIEAAFRSFDISVRVLGHTKGASYTQYAVKLADGVYFRKIVSLEEDLKRKLCLTDPINIVSTVKDMDAVGLEIANPTRAKVGLKQFIKHSNYQKEKKLYFMLGVNVYGEPFFCNILEAPQLLIAGTTGSGKSICINSILCSIIYNYTPDYVKFVLVDPKSVELENFAEMPHNLLGCSVVTAADCIKALDAVIEEMEKRYELMKLSPCKQLTTYNDYRKSINLPPLPYIVVVIDELADLMLSSKKTAPELEKRISRLTAKSRASGIHLIIATQRPSIDVVTGVIKNNIPTRIAFTMGDAVGSKVVIDRGGAEKLYGKGDLLYYSPDYAGLVRLQAPYLDEQEVIDITDYVKANNDSDFDDELFRKIFSEPNPINESRAEEDLHPTDGNIRDKLFEQAVRFAVSLGYISINKLQRQFRIGFTRAGYLIDEMEKRGIVDAPVAGGSRPRTVLISESDLSSVLRGGND